MLISRLTNSFDTHFIVFARLYFFCFGLLESSRRLDWCMSLDFTFSFGHHRHVFGRSHDNWVVKADVVDDGSKLLVSKSLELESHVKSFDALLVLTFPCRPFSCFHPNSPVRFLFLTFIFLLRVHIESPFKLVDCSRSLAFSVTFLITIHSLFLFLRLSARKPV